MTPSSAFVPHRRSLRAVFLLFLALASLFFLAGCLWDEIDSVDVTPEGSTDAVAAAQSDEKLANEAKDKAEKERLSRIKGYNANLETINKAPADSRTQKQMRREIEGQKSLLTDVSPDPVVVSQGNDRIAASNKGDEAKADQLLVEALQDNKNYLLRIAQLTEEAAKAEAALTFTITQQKAQLEENRKANQKAIDDLVAKYNSELNEMRVGWATKGAVILGSLFVALGIAGIALCIYSGIGLKPKNLVACVVLLGGGAVCYAAVPFLAHPWLPWAFAGMLLLMVVGVVVYFFFEMRSHIDEKKNNATDKEVIQEEYDLLRKTAAHIVDRLEEAPAANTKEIFASLKGDMDASMRKLVAELKAERPSKGLSA